MVMTFIYKYQALIAGLLGFLGICITLCLNARLARKMRQDEIAQKRQTLRVALLEEIKVVRKDMNAAVLSLDSDRSSTDHYSEQEKYYVPIYPMNDVYKSSIERIGILLPSEARRSYGLI